MRLSRERGSEGARAGGRAVDWSCIHVDIHCMASCRLRTVFVLCPLGVRCAGAAKNQQPKYLNSKQLKKNVLWEYHVQESAWVKIKVNRAKADMVS